MTPRRFSKKRITQADVARHANVSQSLVSYVINDNVAISIPEETRQRILDAMGELGYVPNITARRLRSSKTYTIAGIIPDILNPFYPAFERGIQDVAEQYGYDLMMYNTDSNAEKERKCIDLLLQGRADGLVGVFFHVTARDLLPALERNIFVVRLEAREKPTGPWPLDNIFLDNTAAAQTATTYLIQHGHTRIGMLANQDGPSQFRLQGYRNALQDHSLPIDPELIRVGEFNADGGYRTMQQLLDLDRRPTAVFASNDLMAMGAMAAIRQADLSIPSDIAVVGFDDIPAARLVYPTLTTIAQHQRRMGQRAAEMLFERLAGNVPKSGRNEQMPYELVIRDSA
jgi:LacI family transcriptional regulator